MPDLLLLSLGAVLLFTRDVTDAAALPPAVAAGGVAAFLALLALTVAETDEAFANAYSGAVSSQNLFPWIPQRALVVVTTSLGVVGALTIDLLSFQTFLLLLGSVFVPLFGVLLADWLVAGRRYDEVDVFGAPPWRPGMIAVWVLGFVVYQWLAPTGPEWWVELVAHLDPPGWGIGATIPSFAVTVAVGLAVAVAPRAVRVSRAADMSVAIIGNLCVDRVAGGAPRAGGPVFYAAHAAVRLGADARLAARCAGSDADVALTPLEGTGLPLVWQPGGSRPRSRSTTRASVA